MLNRVCENLLYSKIFSEKGEIDEKITVKLCRLTVIIPSDFDDVAGVAGFEPTK